jgi:RNA polymerase sigma factor (TIGR02999 family)
LASDDVTALLAQWREHSPAADDRLMEAVQSELRRLARRYLRHERPDHTLQPTELVNEAYMRLVHQREIDWKERAHFFGVAAQMMRRILVEHARRRGAAKRDGAVLQPRWFIAGPVLGRSIDVLTLHEALSDLAKLDSRQAEITELRYFGGLTIEEIALLKDISAATVKRDLATAQLWLRRRMRES